MGTVTPKRRAMIAKIKIAQKQLGLDDGAYRAVLLRVAGHSSAADCNDTQLDAVLRDLKRLGFRATQRRFPQAAQLRKIYAVFADIRPHLSTPDTDAALRSFVTRQTKTRANPQGVSAVEFLDAKLATRVLEGLKAWRERLLKAA